MEYNVNLVWDDKAEVWVAQSPDVPGLVLESGSFDALIERVRYVAPEILKENGKEHENVYLNFATKRREKAYA